MASDLIFQGNTRIHLYGRNALIPISLTNQVLTMVIGTETSDLTVNEHRYSIIQVIKKSHPDCYPNGFLQAFNQPAHIEISYKASKESLQIDLYDKETYAEDNQLILWMGVLDDNLMPNYEVEWEVLKPIDRTRTAVCALVKTLPEISRDQFSLASASDEEILFST
jgi:hypothetical protein